MPYNTENILESEIAYKVFRFITSKEDGSYSSEIARELDMKQPMASEIIGNLKEVGLIQKGKRTRATYYKLDKKGIFELHKKITKEDIDKQVEKGIYSEKRLEKIIESLKQEYDSELEYSLEEALNKDYEVFLRLYGDYYLEDFEESTIKNMLVDHFYQSVLMHDSYFDVKPPIWFLYVKDIANLWLTHKDYKKPLMNALVEYKDVPDRISEREKEN